MMLLKLENTERLRVTRWRQQRKRDKHTVRVMTAATINLDNTLQMVGDIRKAGGSKRFVI